MPINSPPEGIYSGAWGTWEAWLMAALDSRWNSWFVLVLKTVAKRILGKTLKFANEIPAARLVKPESMISVVSSPKRKLGDKVMMLRCILDGLELEAYWEMGRLLLWDGDESFFLQKNEAAFYEVTKASTWEWHEIIRQDYLKLRWAADFASYSGNQSSLN